MDTSFGLIANHRENVSIQNDGFFPDISTEGLTDRFALDGQFKQALLVSFIQMAMSHCNAALANAKSRWMNQGFHTLAEVQPVSHIGGESEYLMLYQNALYFEAYAEVCSTQSREQRNALEAEERLDRASVYRQKSNFALGRLAGKGKIQVVTI